MWKSTDFTLINTFNDTNEVYSVCFSPTESIIASGNDDWYLKLWDIEKGSEITYRKLQGLVMSI